MNSTEARAWGQPPAGGLVADSRVRVRYAETDQMGVVYHTHFFIWFEVGRVEFLRQLGFTYREMEAKDGCFLPVVDARCRYNSPARYDDELLVRTHLKNLRGTFLHFAYEVRRAADELLLAEGETTHIVTNAEMKPRPLAEKYLDAFSRAIDRQVPAAGKGA